MKATALLFPGQGSQTIGMGKGIIDSFSVARETMQLADDTLGMHLTKMIMEGNIADLTLTHNAQPAIFSVSMAIFKTLQAEFGSKKLASYYAGHSLGEYSALCAAEVFPFEIGLKLVRLRGYAMQKCALKSDEDHEKGAMAAIIGLSIEDIENIMKGPSASLNVDETKDVCVIANDNAPGQVVISGKSTTVSDVIARAVQKGAKKAIPLNVSGAFHSPLMKEASDKMREAITALQFKNPIVPVFSNVTAFPQESSENIKKFLIEQVTGRVRWTETIQNMLEMGIEKTIEVGPGRVLSGLSRRISRNLDIQAINTPYDVEEFVKISSIVAAG